MASTINHNPQQEATESGSKNKLRSSRYPLTQMLPGNYFSAPFCPLNSCQKKKDLNRKRKMPAHKPGSEHRYNKSLGLVRPRKSLFFGRRITPAAMIHTDLRFPFCCPAVRNDESRFSDDEIISISLIGSMEFLMIQTTEKKIISTNFHHK